VTRIRSFAPVAESSATLLILGSIPGLASLRAGQYYAHPRNQFWRILGEVIDVESERPYADRVRRLTSSRIALWDVLQSCMRAGSLDADIESGSIVPNDFVRFFTGHPQIRRVVFNGSTAERCFRRHVLPGLPDRPLEYVRLPSTSPAHAALSYRQKLEAWRHVLRGAGRMPVPGSRLARR
jgi:hypoxanthine-DNA glycosylase